MTLSNARKLAQLLRDESEGYHAFVVRDRDKDARSGRAARLITNAPDHVVESLATLAGVQS